MLRNLRFVGKQTGVFGEFLGEVANVGADFAQHGQVTRVLDHAFELLGQRKCLVSLFDLAFFAGLTRACFTALVQTHPRFIHRLQHQP